MDKTEQEKDTYSWLLRVEYFVDIFQEYKTKPSCSSLKKQLEKAIDEVLEQYNNQYRVYDYTDNVSEQEIEVGFESEEGE